MKKQLVVNRIITLLIGISILFSVVLFTPVLPNRAAGLTLRQLQNKFPDGAYWNHKTNNKHRDPCTDGACNNPDGYTWEPCYIHGAPPVIGKNDCNTSGIDRSLQCEGFATKLAYDAYGSNCKDWDHRDWDQTTAADIKPGDVIAYKNKDTKPIDPNEFEWPHWVFVIGVEGDEIIVGECNELKYSGRGWCNITWGRRINIWTQYRKFTIYSAPWQLDTGGAADIGDNFCAVILSRDIWKPIRNVNGNVEMWAETNSAAEKWLFYRQSDGSYLIKSCLDGKVLDVTGGGTVDCTNVAAAEWGGENNPAQSWFIRKAGDDNRVNFSPKCAPHLYMDVAGNNSADGTNILLFTASDASNQQFAIFHVEDRRASLSSISITANRTAVDVGENIQLNAVFDPVDTVYNTVKWTSENEAIATVDETGKVTAKSAGIVTIRCNNTFNPAGYESRIALVVRGESEDLGDDFYATILSRDIWKPIRSTGENVELRAEEHIAPEIWNFRRQEDGTYIIKSCLDGKVLAVPDSGKTDYPNVEVCEPQGVDADMQKWYIYSVGNDNRLIFIPKSESGMCMDVAGGSSDDGTNINLFTVHNTENQQFAKYDIEEYRTKLNKITISAERTKAEVGESIQLNAIYDPVDTIFNTVRWSSEDESIATVDANGKVTAKKDGEVVIKCNNTFYTKTVAEITLTIGDVHKEPEKEPEKEPVKGDADGNGKVNLLDLMQCLNHVAKKTTLTGNAFLAADVDGNGKVDLFDLMRILNYVAKKTTNV